MLICKDTKAKKWSAMKKNCILINFTFLFHASSCQESEGQKKIKEIVTVYI